MAFFSANPGLISSDQLHPTEAGYAAMRQQWADAMISNVYAASAAPAVGLSPTSLALGFQSLGSTSAAQSTTLTNTGTAALSIDGIAVSGTNAGDFAQTNTCPASPATLAVGASCSISVSFAPRATGSRAAAVRVTDTASDSPQSVALSGTGTTARAVTLSPASVSFGSQTVAKTRAAQLVTLTNSGSAALSISSIGITGTNAGDFAQTSTCPVSPASLARGANCTISVTFTPAAAGSRMAGLSVTDDAGGSPQTVALSGTGSTSSIAFDKTLGQLAENASASTIHVTTSAAAASGSRVFVFVDWYSPTRTLSSVSGGGLSWSVDVQAKDTTSYHTAIASANAPTGLALGTALTATFSQTVTPGLIAAASFTGIAPSAPVDVTVSGLQNGVAPWSGSVVTTNASDLVLGWSGIDNITTSTAASPNIKLFDLGNTDHGEQATAEYQIDTTTGTKTINGTWASASGATANSITIAAYKSG